MSINLKEASQFPWQIVPNDCVLRSAIAERSTKVTSSGIYNTFLNRSAFAERKTQIPFMLV